MNDFSLAFTEIRRALGSLTLVGLLGWQDVRGRYRRSAIGPFWLTISMGVMIASIGLVFGQIFNSPMRDYLPFLTAGMIIWTFITGLINEGCMCFIDAQGVIRQLPIPLFVHVLRTIWRNCLIFAHNILVFPLVFLLMGKELSFVVLLAIPGLLLVVLCMSWIVLILAMVCARYRDFPQIIASVLQVVFYLTPIMWMPSLLPDRMGVTFLQINPFYHLLELVRNPLLGQLPSLTNWSVVVGIAFIGWVFALLVFARYRKRVAYWL